MLAQILGALVVEYQRVLADGELQLRTEGEGRGLFGGFVLIVGGRVRVLVGGILGRVADAGEVVVGKNEGFGVRIFRGEEFCEVAFFLFAEVVE